MSDVVVRSEWTEIAEGKKAYNEVLTLYAKDSDDTVCGLQQYPPREGYTTIDGLSTKMQGTNLSSGYWGEWVKEEVVSNDVGSVTSINYYFRNSLVGFDITNLKCYILFRNLYFNSDLSASTYMDIASWSLSIDDGSVIASGDSLSYGERIEVEFINDYDTVNFKLTLNVSGEPSSIGHWLYCPYGSSYYSYGNNRYRLDTDMPNGLFLTNINGYWYYATFETQAPSSNPKLLGPYRSANGGNWYGGYWNYNQYGCDATWSDGGYLYKKSPNGYSGSAGSYLRELLTNLGYTGYSNITEAVSDLYGGTFGFNTINFNNYTGTIFTARMYADISKRFPSTTNDDQTGGTVGTFDDTTDTNTVPVLPTADSYVPDEITGNNTTGFNIYKLSPEQFRKVRRALFSTDIITSLRNFFSKPTDGIISLGRMPYSPPPAGSDVPIYIGNTVLVYQDGVAVNAEGTPINRFNSYDFGNVTILPYWDTALDYNPYTEIKIHLPYIGTRNLNTDLIMGKAIGLKYHIDCITGTCVAFITADGDLVYQFTGNMMTPCPLSGEDYSQMYGNLLTSSVLAGVTVAAYGGNPIMSAGAGIGAANSALHSKREFTNNGTFGGSSSMMENNQPYIEIVRPVQSRPRDYGKYKGYVSTKTKLLGDCDGYVKILDCDLSGITATEEERDEIMELLKGGIYV